MIHYDKDILMVLSKYRATNLIEFSVVTVCQPFNIPISALQFMSQIYRYIPYLGCSSDHCGATDINIFDAILKRNGTRSDFVIERIQIHHNHIECPCSRKKKLLAHILFSANKITRNIDATIKSR